MFYFIVCDYVLICYVEYRVSLVVALNPGPFTTVAFNGLVGGGRQLKKVLRDLGGGKDIIEVTCSGFSETLLSLPAVSLHDYYCPWNSFHSL